MYVFHEDEFKQKLEGRYWNAQSLNLCVIASITKRIAWAAYIGAAPEAHTEDEALKFVTDYGQKLTETDARYFFPDIELPYRR